ncbi:uncharacterized protein LOC110931451 [Helianthus annuus]|uniref:uncharacterized protein LOC110931451 n=1 Tax=Helianthus annuus TaxID=4232 RepID=UPI000B8F1B1A|nr:uncharacterized protein LOC110931451 [Helianthus annuus]
MDVEEFLAYMHYESQQYIPIKQEVEIVSAKEVSKKVPVKLKNLKEKQAAKRKNQKAEIVKKEIKIEKEESEKPVSVNLEPVFKKEVTKNTSIFDHSSEEESKNEIVHEEKKQVEKISALKVETKADDKQIPRKCLNCEKSESGKL